MTEQDKPQDTTSPTPEPSKERDRLAAYRGDLAGAERQASQVVSLGRQQVFMGLGMVGFFLSLFLPHSGKVLGLDVLFYSDTAQQYVTTVPERIYMWLALIAAVLLNAATLVTRSALIAYLTWFFSGAAMFYSVFAIWMRQSRPPTEPGVGPSFGLIIGTVSVSVVAAALSFVVLRRNSFQAALAARIFSTISPLSLDKSGIFASCCRMSSTSARRWGSRLRQMLKACTSREATCGLKRSISSIFPAIKR